MNQPKLTQINKTANQQGKKNVVFMNVFVLLDI